MLFATINLKQTRVNPSLVFDLYGETTLRSPQKTCHNISKLLNETAGSPLHHRIKPLGKRTDEYVGVLTQATFVKRLLPMVCSESDAVRDEIKRGLTPNSDDPRMKGNVFWRFFAEDKDWAILKVLQNYFSAVRAVFPDDWDSPASPLARAIGFGALMRLLDPLVRRGRSKQPSTLERSFFEEELAKARRLAPFSFEVYPASGAGEGKLYRALATAVGVLDG